MPGGCSGGALEGHGGHRGGRGREGGAVGLPDRDGARCPRLEVARWRRQVPGGPEGDVEQHHRSAGERDEHVSRAETSTRADRHLDQVEHRRRGAQADDDPDREQREAVQAGAGLVQPEEHRPVQQVHAVADPSEQDQGRHREGRRDDVVAQRRDDHRTGAHRRREQPPRVQPRAVEPCDDHERGERCQAGQSRPGREQPGSGRAVAAFVVVGAGPAQHRAGEQRADQQLRGSGVGPEVGTVDRGPRGESVRQGRERREATQHDHQQPEPAARRHPGPGQHRGEQQRQHDVELLLDREAPEVLERRGRRLRGAVAGALRDEVPVDQFGERPGHVAAQVPELLDLPDAGGAHEDHEPDRQPGRGQQPSEASGEEAAQVHPRGRRRRPLAQQQRGDQEAREREEHRHAEEATSSPGDVAVERHDGHDGQGSDAVERRDVAERANLEHPVGSGTSRSAARHPHGVTVASVDPASPGLRDGARFRWGRSAG